MRKGNDLSVWSAGQAEKYANVGHGVDGGLFLDPALKAALSESILRGKRVLDIGTGAGRFAGYALSQGAGEVVAFDVNPAMVERARIELGGETGELPSNLDLKQMDVADMRGVTSDSIDVVMSILVGCNLSADTFKAHFEEAYRVAKPGALFVMAAPNSLSIPFTSNGKTDTIQAHVDEAWESGDLHGASAAKAAIDSLGPSVLRATFILDATTGKPRLITRDFRDELIPGRPIVRKIPGLAVDNNAHSAPEHRTIAERAGWNITTFSEKRFLSETDRRSHNIYAWQDEQLGPNYAKYPPFLLMVMEKN
jgi:SAM-dependent methyltransferase